MGDGSGAPGTTVDDLVDPGVAVLSTDDGSERWSTDPSGDAQRYAAAVVNSDALFVAGTGS